MASLTSTASPVAGAEPDQEPLPPRFVDGYLAYLLALASHRVSEEFHREVEAAGLTIAEWRVLASLTGREQESISTLTHLTLTKQPTLSKIIQRMEQQGLVQRHDTDADRRKTLVSLTAAGREKTQQHVQQAMRHQAEVLKPLSAKEAALLMRVLRKILLQPPA